MWGIQYLTRLATPPDAVILNRYRVLLNVRPPDASKPENVLAGWYLAKVVYIATSKSRQVRATLSPP